MSIVYNNRVVEDNGFFSGMSGLNKASLGFFVLAKLCGMFGVGLGFCGPEYRTAGGFLLAAAFGFIFSAVCCSLLQSRRDRETFGEQDIESARIREMKLAKAELEEEIKELELHREALRNMILRR